MTRVVVKFKNGEHINVVADTIEVKNSDIIVNNNGKIVVVTKIKEIISCYLCEQREVVARDDTLRRYN